MDEARERGLGRGDDVRWWRGRATGYDCVPWTWRRRRTDGAKDLPRECAPIHGERDLWCRTNFIRGSIDCKPQRVRSVSIRSRSGWRINGPHRKWRDRIKWALLQHRGAVRWFRGVWNRSGRGVKRLHEWQSRRTVRPRRRWMRWFFSVDAGQRRRWRIGGFRKDANRRHPRSRRRWRGWCERFHGYGRDRGRL